MDATAIPTVWSRKSCTGPVLLASSAMHTIQNQILGSAKIAPVYEEVYVWGAKLSKSLSCNQLGFMALTIVSPLSPLCPMP